MNKKDEEFLVYCTEMRMEGVHADWLRVWRGSFEEARDDGRDWMAGVRAYWPMDVHMRPVDPRNDFLVDLMDRGSKWWDSL